MSGSIPFGELTPIQQIDSVAGVLDDVVPHITTPEIEMALRGCMLSIADAVALLDRDVAERMANFAQTALPSQLSVMIKTLLIRGIEQNL